jgi:hypothetical protein
MLKVVNGKFVVSFAQPGKPFVCLERNTPDVTKTQPTYLR